MRLISALRAVGVLGLLLLSPCGALPPRSALSTAYNTAMERGRRERESGNIAYALQSFQSASDVAQSLKHSAEQASALLAVTGCQLRLYRYRQALDSANAAHQLALEAKDDGLAGAAANNKATIYSQVGDNLSAADAAKESVTLLQHSLRKDYFAISLLNYGDILAQLKETRQSTDAFQQAVSVAHIAGFTKIEGEAQTHLGDSLLDLGDLVGAEKALKAAQDLCKRQNDNLGLGLINADLAELYYYKKAFPEALRLLNQVVAARTGISTLHPYWPWHLRGKILLALGRRTEALSNFQKAAVIASNWQRDVLPADATSTRTVVALHQVYQDYIELAAQLALDRHDPALAQQSYNVLIENRASSLRAQMLLALGREMRLPARYLELLSILQSTQASVTLGPNSKVLPANKAKLDGIRLELTDLENKIGLPRETFSLTVEKSSHKTSLRNIRESLSGTELLLSFCLGRDKSFLFAVTRDDMNLYELPAQDRIAAHAVAFSQAVQRGSSNAEGSVLSRDLFGKLPPRAMQKPEWLIAADGALLDSVPFAALPQSSKSDTALANSHSLRFLPSELLLTDAKAPAPQRRFVGVADPIYNLADSRRPRSFSFLQVEHADSSVTLARLVGSEREVRSAAKLTGIANVDFLVGSNATGRNLRAALAKAPEILHFAVHVVSPPSRSGGGDETALALSLTAANMPELLTKEVIATLRVPGSLVVLSGCSSQQGENLPSAGLIGLSRAFLLAGASAVVVSAWPTPDDSGRFFTAFYQHLQSQPAQAGNPARRASTALQQSQKDMQQSSGYRSSPSFWAAYSLISKE